MTADQKELVALRRKLRAVVQSGKDVSDKDEKRLEELTRKTGMVEEIGPEEDWLPLPK